MKTIKLLPICFSSLLLAACIFLTSYQAIAYGEDKQNERLPLSNAQENTQNKKELARKVLLELGIGERYNLYFKNVVDMAANLNSKPEYRAWLHQTLVKFTGWEYVKTEYVKYLEANFTELELKELVKLAKLPLMKKFLTAEIQAYANTSEKRFRLFQKFWDDYSSGLIETPQTF